MQVNEQILIKNEIFCVFCKNNNLDYFINSILENSKLDERVYEFLIIDGENGFSFNRVENKNLTLIEEDNLTENLAEIFSKRKTIYITSNHKIKLKNKVIIVRDYSKLKNKYELKWFFNQTENEIMNSAIYFIICGSNEKEMIQLSGKIGVPLINY